MPHLHLSSLVTKKKIETGVIFFHSTSRLCTYPYLAHLLYIIKCVPHCPVLAAAAPDPTDVAAGKTDAAAGKTDAAAGKTGTPTEYPATAHPTSTTCGQPPHRHHTKRRGAIYDARRPTGRNHRRMTTRPRRHADTKITRQGETTGEPNTLAAAHPTSTTCGQPPRRHHTKRRGAIYDSRRPAGRNHRRTQHPAATRPTPATVHAADILPPTGGSGRHKWRPYDTPTPR